MIVTIDGPAGAGKSTVARELARRLGFRLLDTGAMYRAVALAAIDRQLDWDDPEALVALAKEVRIELGEDRVLLDGQDVTRAIRTHAVSSATHYAANNPGVRAHLVELQRQSVGAENVVCEGRDQGTVVFPQAACKIYLTASPEERARRRAEELAARGEPVPVEEVLAGQNLRDKRDATRAVGRLTPAHDAVEVCTNSLTSEEVVERLERIVREKMQSLGLH
jgi:cytidylate kinase